MESTENERELTQEELQARKDEMLQFYTESVPYLEAQLKHEDLLAKIDEARFKRAQYQIQMAMMMNPPQEQEGSPEELREEIQKERKLKKS